MTYDAGGRSNRVATEESHLYKTEGSATVDYRTMTTNTYVDTVLATSISYNHKETASGAGWTDSGLKHSRLDYDYVWYDAAQQYRVKNYYDYPALTTGTVMGQVSQYWLNGFNYDDYGRLTRVEVADGRQRSIYYTNNADGQVIHRFEDEVARNIGNPTLINHIFNGKLVGQIGNDRDDNTTYAEAINQRTTTSQNGPFAGGTSTSVTAWSDYDQSYQAINPGTIGATASAYTAHSGDTLQSIAAGMWGDASLWYLIAEANGLSGSEVLAEGQALTIPNKVANFHNNSDTFAVYDPNQAIGDTSPSAPKPPKKPKCGAFGQILQAIVTIAIAIVLAPTIGIVPAAMLGSAIGQGFGIATGIQVGGFNFKQVAIAGVTALVTAGVGQVVGQGTMLGSQLVGDVARGALTNAITQGVAVASGLQDKFSWAGVAAAGVVGGVGGDIGRGLGQKGGIFGITAKAGSFGNDLVSGLAGGIAGAATRSALTGTSFGDNVLAVLPDVIGSTIGKLVANGVASSSRKSSEPRLAYEDVLGGDDSVTGGLGNGAAASGSPLTAQELLYRAETQSYARATGRLSSSVQFSGGESFSPSVSLASPAEFEGFIPLNDGKRHNDTVTFDADTGDVAVTASAQPRRGLGWRIADALGFHKGGFFYNQFHGLNSDGTVNTNLKARGDAELATSQSFYCALDQYAHWSATPTGGEMPRIADYPALWMVPGAPAEAQVMLMINAQKYVPETRGTRPMVRGDFVEAGANLIVGVSVLAPLARGAQLERLGTDMARVANAADVIGAEIISAERSTTARIIYDAPIGPSLPAAAESVPLIGGSARLRYMGGTPDKFSRTGTDVVNRMRADGLIVGEGALLRGNPNNLQLVVGDGKLVTIDRTIDMAHRTDAVSWWNSTGRVFGPKSPEVRQFMLNSDNYILQQSSINRSAGARLGQTYHPPVAPDFTILKR